MENYPFYWTYANYCYAIFKQAEVRAEQSRVEQSRAEHTLPLSAATDTYLLPSSGQAWLAMQRSHREREIRDKCFVAAR